MSETHLHEAHSTVESHKGCFGLPFLLNTSTILGTWKTFQKDVYEKGKERKKKHERTSQ